MKVIKLEEIDSTNNYAKTHIEDLCDRTIVVAERQTNGRGRLNRSWIDLGKGNLFFSIVLKPSENFNPVFTNLTQYVSVILCKIFGNYGLDAKIKWPNDVMIDGQRKISGILSESVIENKSLKGIVVGIGINLNSTDDDVKKIEGRVVTSLNLETGKIVDKQEFLDNFLNDFFAQYDEFLKYGFEYIKQDYINLNCFLNKEIQVQVLNDLKTGYASNINNKGELVLKSEDKELALTIGDIL